MVELLVVVLMGTILLGLLVPAPSAPAWRGKRGTTFG
jgi:hypothetical protein